MINDIDEVLDNKYNDLVSSQEDQKEIGFNVKHTIHTEGWTWIEQLLDRAIADLNSIQGIKDEIDLKARQKAYEVLVRFKNLIYEQPENAERIQRAQEKQKNQ